MTTKKIVKEAEIPLEIKIRFIEKLISDGECASAREVMIENCNYWGQFSCDTTKDVSLPQIEWYIENMCKFSSKKYNLDCSNLQLACNQITGSQTCPV